MMKYDDEIEVLTIENFHGGFIHFQSCESGVVIQNPEILVDSKFESIFDYQKKSLRLKNMQWNWEKYHCQNPLIIKVKNDTKIYLKEVYGGDITFKYTLPFLKVENLLENLSEFPPQVLFLHSNFQIKELEISSNIGCEGGIHQVGNCSIVVKSEYNNFPRFNLKMWSLVGKLQYQDPNFSITLAGNYAFFVCTGLDYNPVHIGMAR